MIYHYYHEHLGNLATADYVRGSIGGPYADGATPCCSGVDHQQWLDYCVRSHEIPSVTWPRYCVLV